MNHRKITSKLLRIAREVVLGGSMPPGWEGFDQPTTPTRPMTPGEKHLQNTVHFLSRLKNGDLVQVGRNKTVFRVWGQHGPYGASYVLVVKHDTKGRKYYVMKIQEHAGVGVYLVKGGGTDTVGPSIVPLGTPKLVGHINVSSPSSNLE